MPPSISSARVVPVRLPVKFGSCSIRAAAPSGRPWFQRVALASLALAGVAFLATAVFSTNESTRKEPTKFFSQCPPLESPLAVANKEHQENEKGRAEGEESSAILSVDVGPARLVGTCAASYPRLLASLSSPLPWPPSTQNYF